MAWQLTLKHNPFYPAGHCTNLVTVFLPPHLQVIGASAFFRCSNLQEVCIPGSVLEIRKNAFKHCTSLMKVEFPPAGENAHAHAHAHAHAVPPAYCVLTKRLAVEWCTPGHCLFEAAGWHGMPSFVAFVCADTCALLI